MPVPVEMIMLTFRLRLTRDLGRDVRHTHSGNLIFYSVRSSAEYFDHTGKVIPVRSSDAFPNGMTFHDVNEFRAGLLEQKDELARSIAEGLLSYGLGRHVEFSDQQAIDNILKTSERNEHRIGDLIFAIVSHPVFRRNDPIAIDSIQGKNAP